MSEIQGTFEYRGITFKAGYRYNDHPYSGGFDQCLRIYHGKDGKLYPHDYFGDDKFEVESAKIYADDVVLEMKFPLNHKDDLVLDGPDIIVLKRIK